MVAFIAAPYITQASHQLPLFYQRIVLKVRNQYSFNSHEKSLSISKKNAEPAVFTQHSEREIILLVGSQN
jgi:hypothetical protein